MTSLSVCLQEAATEEPRPQLGHGSLALLVEFASWFHNEGGQDVHQLNCVPWRTIVYKGGNGTKHATGVAREGGVVPGHAPQEQGRTPGCTYAVYKWP